MINGRKQVLIIDGYNFMHRARAGFTVGEYPVVYNFFRNLRALLEALPSDRVLFVTEGVPKKRLVEFPEYKANRDIDPADEKRIVEMTNFHRQKDIIIDMLGKHFPVTVVRHRDYECDDVVYTIVKNGAESTDYTLVSTDTDFIQMLSEFPNFRIYHPSKKEFVRGTPYDYVMWKALRGDATDNIPGIPGVGDVTAEELALDYNKLRAFLGEDESRQSQFLKNVGLIKLAHIGEDEESGWESSQPYGNWKPVQERFEAMQFKSILKDTYWKRFTDTFNMLWEVRS